MNTHAKEQTVRDIAKMINPLYKISLLEKELVREEVVKIVNSFFKLTPSINSVRTMVHEEYSSGKLELVEVNGEEVPSYSGKEGLDSFLFSANIKEEENYYLWHFLIALENSLMCHNRSVVVLNEVLNNYKRE